ncbi:autotransporter domain-containing protein [Bradyrhizobium sp. Arg68]|uniref:autotransporter outer membrane beta-barrel domain-containing protein n=1 Tax=Bradyrhizobium ivorense TaxID=2511166 RepID=UPI0027E36C32|nr:autotransporter domain-containing protein [Bradyrhizobium ivorense]MCC8937448.1 autotransporter domain-containing protein [Bradyrhizobium ivorense]
MKTVSVAGHMRARWLRAALLAGAASVAGNLPAQSRVLDLHGSDLTVPVLSDLFPDESTYTAVTNTGGGHPIGNLGNGAILTITSFGFFRGPITDGSPGSSILGLAISGDGTVVTLRGTNTYSGGTYLNTSFFSQGLMVSSDANLGSASSPLIFNGGTLSTRGTFTIARPVILDAGGGIFALESDHQITVTGSITGTGALTTHTVGYTDPSPPSFPPTGPTPRLVLTADNSYTGGTNINSGIIAVSRDANLGAPVGDLRFNGGTLQYLASFDTARNVFLTLGLYENSTFDTNGFSSTLSGTISGPGLLNKGGLGTLALSGTNTFSGDTTLNEGAIAIGNNSALGTSALTMKAGTTLSFLATGNFNLPNRISIAGDTSFTPPAGTTQTLSGVIADGASPGSLNVNGAGTLVLGAANTYSGATFVNSGVLQVDGSIVASPLTMVGAGAALAGIGSVGATQIHSNGIFAPGNGTPGTSLTVAGGLAFESGALYLVQLNPTTSSFASVTGQAALGGATVNAVYAAGSYVSKQYTILTAAGGVVGSFGSLVNTNLPANFTTGLSYDAQNVFLNLALNFVPPPNSGLNQNQQNVASAIVNFFNTNGTIPLAFGGLTAAGLTQVAGENATAAQQTAFSAMNQFMGVMTDPFVAGRGDPIGGGPAAYADETLAYAAKRPTDALAMATKAPPLAPGFEQRWSVWAAGFGGSQRTDGSTVLGSNDTRSSIYGAAVGADYRFSPDTLAGFALAGGGTNFSVNGLGSGRSDLFQAGGFIRHNIGAAYLGGALAYGWQDITTDRIVTVAGLDRLRAEFNANAWSGRAEGGYRFVTAGFGITPYAAGQFTTFDLPAYMEQAIAGANTFALAYRAKSVTDSRSELGVRTDKAFAMQDGILTLRGRVAWAHDFDPDRSVLATFQTLPGASFVANGATQASDAALTTASVEMKWLNGWSAAATFEGEFSNVTTSYAGKGVVRYAW